ncbi:DUF92 domain-containing protein [Heyndrickxia sp. MSNUG]|uniref:DUF92 domain-containing protein n=1 Tax=Heyndrickxia sp. MSNUG TaxID=3136677 RepID=UPI003C2CEF4E
MGAEQLIIPFFIATVAAASFYFKFLSLSGTVSAFVTGLFIWSGFGIKGLILLGIFFVTSSLLSKYKQKRKENLGEVHEKGSARDWAQVAANGGTAAIAGLMNILFPDPVWMLAFSISLASANSDTWASELGVLSKSDPISIRGFKKVPRGTSGAISRFGTLAAAAGSLLIAFAANLLFNLDLDWTVAIFVLGLAGSFVDTLLGAFLQAGYQCVECGLHTEKTMHCSKKTAQLTGHERVNNDAVNFLSGFAAANMGMIIYIVLS